MVFFSSVFMNYYPPCYGSDPGHLWGLDAWINAYEVEMHHLLYLWPTGYLYRLCSVD